MFAIYNKIGLLDHMGWGNMGDAAVQESFIRNIKKRVPNAELVAFSLKPEDTRRRHGLECYPIVWSYPESVSATTSPAIPRHRKRLKGLLKKWRLLYAVAKPLHDLGQEIAHIARSFCAVRSLDLLIISGGGQLSEMWRGPWAHPYNIFKFSMLAKLSRTPLLIVGVGAGPLKHPLSKLFVRWSVGCARYVSLRDFESRDLICSLGTVVKTEVFPDPAYALPVADYVNGDRSSRARPRIGINPIGFCDPRIWPHPDEKEYQRYLSKVEASCTRLLERGYDIEIFTSDISVDHYAMEELYNRLSQQRGAEPSSFLTTVARLELEGLVSQISQFDFVITSKFHGVIFSHLLAKPVIALSYHSKIDDLMRAVGHEEYCLPISNFTSESLMATFDSLVRNQAQLKTLFLQTTTAYAAAVDEQFDRVFATTGYRKSHQGPAKETQALYAAEERRA